MKANRIAIAVTGIVALLTGADIAVASANAGAFVSSGSGWNSLFNVIAPVSEENPTPFYLPEFVVFIVALLLFLLAVL